MNKLMSHQEVKDYCQSIADMVQLDDDSLVNRFYACGEQGRDEDAEPLRKEILRRMESRIY